MVGGTSTSELLKAALNSGRTPSSSGIGRPSSKRSSKASTPKQALSANVSDDEFDDTDSVASDDTWVVAGDEEAGAKAVEAGDNWESILGDALESVGDKRVVSREKGLSTIVRVMSLRFIGDGLENSRVTLLEALKRSVRNNKSEKEALLALLAIGQWFVNFGMEHANEYASIDKQLKTLISDHKVDSVRALALNMLGLANFISGTDHNDAAGVMRFISDRFFSATAAAPVVVLRQALETYGFLMTVLVAGNRALAERTFQQSDFQGHMKALCAETIDLRLAAAQNFALMHEALSHDGHLYEFDQQEELVATLLSIKHESSKRHGKRVTQAQRSAMRDVLKSIETGKAPKMQLIFVGRSVVFDRWERIIRLHVFKAVLGSGLPVHFVDNPLLRDIFEVEFDTSGDAGVQNQGRVVVDRKSELAKERSRKLRKSRNTSRNAYSADDDYSYE
ncbi:Interferon- developmental regulator 1 [Kickxella alabastrina]|uniref:Interferon- developmental regulator 1 n=1 Tax=Kickxella alabastrina TaxID=61397 RepID=A0ACC1IGC4_9FUNG|nr:Interferon- developmental regulator 1 [Kickxella alabastrina]